MLNRLLGSTRVTSRCLGSHVVVVNSFSFSICEHYHIEQLRTFAETDWNILAL